LQLTKEGITFEQAMKMIQNSTDKNATSLELFGKRGAVVGTILAENTDITAKLTEELNNSTGASAKMAETQLDTLGGALKLLQSAWEGWILKTNEAGGAGEDIKEIIQTLAENLEWILDTIVTVGRAWLTYKAITMLQVGANRLLASSFMQGVKGMGVFRGAIRGVKSAVIGLGNAIKANIIGIALFAIMDMVAHWQKINGILDTVQENADNLARSISKLETESKKEQKTVNLLFDALSKTNPESEERLNLMNKINREYGTTLKNMESEIDFQKQLAVAQREVIDNIKMKMEAEKIRITYELAVQEAAKSDFEVKKAERALQEFKNKGGGEKLLRTLFDKFGVESENDLIDVLNAWYDVDFANRQILDDAEKEWEQLQINQATTKSASQIACENKGGTWNSVTKTCSFGGGGAGAGGGGGNKRTSLLREIEDEVISQIDDEEQREMKKAQVTAERRIEDLKKVKAYRSEKKRLTTEIEESLELELEKIRKKFRKKEIQEQLKRNKQWVATKKAERDLALNQLPDNIENFEAREKIFEKFENQRKKALERQMNWELRNKDLTEQEKKKIVAEYYLAIDKLDRESIARSKTNQEKLLEDLNEKYTLAEKTKRLELLRSNKKQEEIDKAFLNYQIEALEKLIEQRKKLGLSTIDEEIKLEELKRQKVATATKADLASAKALADEQIAIIESVTQATIALIDRRIEKIDEEIEKHEEKYSRLAELAKQGNINAQQSLAVEAKLIAEANRKKEKMERQKQRVQLAGDALQAYMRNSEDPDVKNPLLKTFTDITLLTQFIQNLPFFEDGIEDTGKHGRGVDGKGGFLSVLHPNERVLTKAQNAMIGDMSNEDLAQMALKQKTKSMMDANVLKNKTSNDTAQVVDALTSLEQTIKNKPETNIEFERIIDGAMQVVRKTKQGNTVTFNRYRTQK